MIEVLSTWKDYFFPVEAVVAEKLTEKGKGHGIQAVNNPHGYSKNCPHIDILTRRALVHQCSPGEAHLMSV